MRVSLVNLNLDAHDAIGQSILQQLRFFRRRGDDVRIYTLHPPTGVPADVIAATQVVRPGDLAAKRARHFATSDLYVYHYPGRHPLMDSLKELDRGGVIFYFHNVTPPDLWVGSDEQHSLQADLEAVNLLAPLADTIVTPSAFNADQLHEEHGIDRDRVRVLPLAVPLDEFGPRPAEPTLVDRYGLTDRAVILFVGRMAGNKRIDLLVEALPRVRQAVPNACLLLVGDSAGNPAFQQVVEQVKTRADELDVADAVIFAGRVDDLAAHYNLASVYATASLHEGFGMPLIEAMASGVPVVASRTTAHPWVLADAGMLVEPGNGADLVEKLIEVLQDDALCGELVRRGLDRAREFSVEAYQRGWAAIVSEVSEWLPIQSHPRPRTATRVGPCG